MKRKSFSLGQIRDGLPSLDVERELEAGCRWLIDKLQEAGRDRVIIGLSGGIDSAVASMWAVRALGAERVTLIAMPYGLLTGAHFHPSNFESLDHARVIATAVPNADFRELDIAPTVDIEAQSVGLTADLELTRGNELLRLALANIKARVRAVRLRYFANRLHGLVLGTENKTEHYLGYFTIGGDEESDIEILGNYFKNEVRELAVGLGVPAEIVSKAPSADLWAGQTDEEELGFTYADADHVLHLSQCSDELSPDAKESCTIHPLVTDRVLTRVRATAFKRAPKAIFRRGAEDGQAG